MITPNKPLESKDAFDVVACYLEHEGNFILLQRNVTKPHAGKWGLPAGKVDKNENVVDAIIREVKEETGITVTPSELVTLPSLLVENEGVNFNYHSFLFKLPKCPSITISNKEHSSYIWVTPVKSLEMDLIHDLKECNRLFFNL